MNEKKQLPLEGINKITSSVQISLSVLLLVITLYVFYKIEVFDNTSSRISHIRFLANEELNQRLFNYLSTSDATLLTAITQTLDSIERESLTFENKKKSEQLINLVSEFREFTLSELRASGKLANNLGALLRNNQSEFNSSVAFLIDWIKQETIENNLNITDITPYESLLLQVTLKSNYRATISERFLNAPNTNLKNELNNANDGLSESLTALENMPKLETTSTEPENQSLSLTFDDDDSPYEDSMAELRSLTNRYLKEIENTQKLSLQLEETKRIAKNMLAVINQFVTEKSEQIETESKLLRFNSQIMILVGIVVNLIMLIAAGYLRKKVIQHVVFMEPVFSRLAKGDFSKPIDKRSNIKELSSVIFAAQNMQKNIVSLINNITSQAKGLNSQNQKMQCLSHQLSENVDNQAQIINETNNNLNKVLIHLNQVNDNSEQAQHDADSALSSMQQVDKSAQQTNDAIRKLDLSVDATGEILLELQQKTKEIENILTVIKSIAEQTNLLALNAAIEAARAGDKGRGFSVVADEVRKLALMTSQSTQDIQVIVYDVISHVQKTNEQANSQKQASKALLSASIDNQQHVKNTQDYVANIHTSNKSISGSINQEVRTMDALKQRLEQVNMLSQNCQQLSEDGLQLSDTLVNVSENLETAIGYIKY